ncbi:hypothetical protein ACNKHQ_23795 [Shigella flexneri]
MLFHNGIVGRDDRDAAVYFWMQGLYASIHHFRETGVIRNSVTGKPFSGTGGGASCDAAPHRVWKVPEQLDDTGLVRNTGEKRGGLDSILHGGSSRDLTITERVQVNSCVKTSADAPYGASLFCGCIVTENVARDVREFFSFPSRFHYFRSIDEINREILKQCLFLWITLCVNGYKAGFC